MLSPSLFKGSIQDARTSKKEAYEVGVWFVSEVGARVRVRRYFRGMGEAMWDVMPWYPAVFFFLCR